MARFTLNNNFAQTLRSKATPFAEKENHAYELIFTTKPSRTEEGALKGVVIASSKFNKAQVVFNYRADEAPKEDVTLFLGKEFEQAVAALSSLGEGYSFEPTDSALIIKSGTAVLRVNYLDAGAIVSIADPQKENMIPFKCGTGAWQAAIRRALGATIGSNEEVADTLTLFPHENSVSIYGSSGPMMGKAELSVTPVKSPTGGADWSELVGKTLAVKASELKALIPILGGEELRVFVSLKDQQLIVVSGYDIFTFRLLSKGIPMSEEQLNRLFGVASTAGSAVVEAGGLVKAINIATILQKEDPSIVITGSDDGIAVTNPDDNSCGMSLGVSGAKDWKPFRILLAAPLLKGALGVCGDKVTMLYAENPGKQKNGAFLFLKGEGYEIVVLSKMPKKAPAPAEKSEE